MFVEVIIESAILAADAFCVVGVVKLVLLTFGGVTFVFFFKLFMALGNEIFDTAFVDILGVARKVGQKLHNNCQVELANNAVNAGIII